MNKYALITVDDEVVVIESDGMTVDAGVFMFVNASKKVYMGREFVAAYPTWAVKSVTPQRSFTEEEILNQVTQDA